MDCVSVVVIYDNIVDQLYTYTKQNTGDAEKKFSELLKNADPSLYLTDMDINDALCNGYYNVEENTIYTYCGQDAVYNTIRAHTICISWSLN